MKKTIGIIIAAAAVAGMIALLAGNRKKITEEAQAAKPSDFESVMTETVTRDSFSRSFTSNGVAQASSELNMVSEINGRVIEIYVDRGSRVAKGTPLLKVDTELLEADFKAQKAAYESLKKDEERFTRSFEAGGVTNQQLDNIRTQLIAAEARYTVSRWKLENATVKAPISGTINNRFVEKGALIAPNVPLFEIVNNSSIKVTCNLNASKAGRIRVGQKVQAVCNDAPGEVFTGRVKSVGIKTDRGLNYPVEITMDAASALKVGMYLKVSFEDENGKGTILIPRKAVVGSVHAANVFIVKDGKAVRREVKLGDMAADRIEILEGIAEGDEIITAGLMNISDGSPVRIVNGK